MIKIGPLNCCGRQPEILKHPEEADEDRNHADQSVILRRQQTRKHNC